MDGPSYPCIGTPLASSHAPATPKSGSLDGRRARWPRWGDEQQPGSQAPLAAALESRHSTPPSGIACRV